MLTGPRARSAAWRLIGSRRGVALVSVLWVLMLLSFIAASFNFSTRTDVNLAHNLGESAKAEALADAGVYRAIAGLFQTVGQGGLRVDRTVYGWHFGDGEIRFDIADEGGKIDLNRAKADLLGALFRSLDLDHEAAAALVDAIIDFRDPDDLRRLNGAEDRDYRAAGLKYGAKDGPFEMVEELQQVLGMNNDLYSRAAPALSVYARRRTPFLATAPPEVLAALAELPAGARENRQGQAVADQDEAATSVDNPPGELVILEEGPTEERSRTKVYTLHAEARTANGAYFAREAVVRITGGDVLYRIHAWRRALRRLFEISESGDLEGD